MRDVASRPTTLRPPAALVPVECSIDVRTIDNSCCSSPEQLRNYVVERMLESCEELAIAEGFCKSSRMQQTLVQVQVQQNDHLVKAKGLVMMAEAGDKSGC